MDGKKYFLFCNVLEVVMENLKTCHEEPFISEWHSCSYTLFYHSFLSLLSTGVTILLSLTVFLNTVSETMPVTSDNPLLGKEPSKEKLWAYHFSLATFLSSPV